MGILDIQPRLESQLLSGFTLTSIPMALVITVVILAGLIYTLYEPKPNISHIPILGEELGFQGRKDMMAQKGREFLLRGYKEFNKKGKPFQIALTEGPRIVLNSRQTDEVAAKPDHIVDNMRPNGRFLMDKYTGYLDGDQVIFRIIKSQLSTRLGELGDILGNQADRCLAKEIPPCDDWTPVKIYDCLTRIVAAVSTRVFVGEELTTNEEWLQVTIQYTSQLIECANAIKLIHPWIRPFTYRMLPEYRRLKATGDTATRLVKPLIEACRIAMEKPGFKGGNNMLEWMMAERIRTQFHDKDYQYLAQLQLQLAFAAIHTTSMAATNMLYDIVANPEYIDILRNEINEQLAINNDSWRGNLLKKLQKVDSFMKESQRHNPVGLTTMDRDILVPLTLSDGTFLPKGITISGNGWAIYHDPEILQSGSDPNGFDGLRYYNLRDQLMKTGLDEKEVAGKHQFVSVSNSSMMFGYGKHACPGRFFAGNEIKLLIAKIISQYELKISPEANGRYMNFSHEVANYVDPSKTILMKRIK